MKSYDYNAVIYDGECYCAECLPKDISPDNEEVSPIFADSEHDGYPTCSICGETHKYVNLTSKGYGVECDRENIEVFHMGENEFASRDEGSWMADYMENAGVDWSDPESVKMEAESLAGWYYWCCFPGCMPEGDAVGPFKSELAAQQDAINNA